MRWILASLALITPLTGCGSDTTDTTDNGGRDMVAALAPLPPGGAITGSADVHWVVGQQQFIATAQIAGDVPGAVRPWHVHFGTCATGGDIVGPTGAYTPLTVGADGTAQMTATVDFELDAAVPYHVNVHEAQTAITTIIACGDLAFSGGGGGGGDDQGGGGGGDDDGGGGGY